MKLRYIIVTTLFIFMGSLCSCGKTVADSLDETGRKQETQTSTQLQETNTEIAQETKEDDLHPYEFTLCFAGDVRVSEEAPTTEKLDASENGVYDCISLELITAMQAADVMCINNEFAFSTNGEPLPGKAYTFRANPSRVEVLEELGVDIVNLANNHVYDYGQQACVDTMTTLKDADIKYFGAGNDLEEAMQPEYVEVDGKTVAFVGASRAEKNFMTPQATETEPGILLCYEPELFIETIKEAKEQADFVIAVVHWGTEYSTVLEDVQTETAKEYIDAGADAIIGGHSHCLQGIEYYDGKPILYSLGNFWFTKKSMYSMLVQLHFDGDDENQTVELQIVPAMQEDAYTYYLSDAGQRNEMFEYLESISTDITIDNTGVVHQIQ